MNTKSILTAAAIIAVLFCAHTFSYSQHSSHGGGGNSSGNMGGMNHTAVPDNPNKYASNGGIVKRGGKYNIEMVYQPILAKDPLVFYLMNKKGKPVSNQGIIAKAEITYSDKSTAIITLEPIGENGFAGQMQNKRGSFICFLTLQINGENVITRFDGGTTGKGIVVYTCSMHPDILSDKPGKCPKCGMNLIEKK